MIQRTNNMRRLTRQNVRGGVGTVHTQYLLEEAQLGARLTLCARMTLEPGASIGQHPHDQDAEIYYVLSGCITVNDNGEKKQLHAGDIMFTANGEVHNAANLSDEPAEMLAIVMP